MKQKSLNIIMTKQVEILLGEPKKAILKLSVPIMIGMLVQAVYNLADGIWVAGLGADALAAIGLFFPFFMVIMALGAGIGIGGSSAVSRKIGAGTKKDAENTALHTFLIALVVSILLSLLIFPFINRIFSGLSGNGEVGAMAADYAKILFGGAVIIILVNIGNAVLRGEGNVKKAMYGLILGAGLNIILDPIFIYWLGLGVAGAAIATLISFTVSFLLFSYWLFIKKDIYLDLNLKRFNFNKNILKEILWVGIPSALAQFSMSLSMIFLNIIIVATGGTNGVAIFTSGWRVIMFGVVPLMGMAAGVTAVTGAAYGAKSKYKLKTAYFYAIKVGILMELIIAGFVFVFAPVLANAFSYSEGSAEIYNSLVDFLRITCLFYLAVPLGMLTSALFMGVGSGVNSLIATILRTFVFQLSTAYLLGVVFGFGLTGIWWGIVAGNICSGGVIFMWGRSTVNKIL